MSIDDDDLDTPEKRRDWIESYTGLGGRDETLEKLFLLTRPRMKRQEVVEVARTVLGVEPEAEGRTLCFGHYRFTFDESDRLVGGVCFEVDGGIEIRSDEDTTPL